MQQKILIVEDEVRVAELLEAYLLEAGFSPESLHSGAGVIPWVQEHPPDLILLDRMLPEKDGLTILRELRAFSEIPVIMVTAKSEEIDRLLGLEIGADDYVCKPYSFREVVSRVRAVLRRSRAGQSQPQSQDQPQEQQANGLFDEGALTVCFGTRSMALTMLEFKLLQTLCAQPGRIYSRDQLMARIYPDDRIVSDRTIDSHISKLRKRLEKECSLREVITAVYSAGYRFNPEAV
ncbi:response regulator [Desulfogranum mediterraneum]|uniref:response regulator n=1 Tax=Desulfogranum mediterraneum TaxID=160661 RepID=UPI000403128C|nr:response regulator [Desulfogranum mediterraneum]